MKKGILVIPDVHGREFWKEVVDCKKYERIIFLGDYTDPYDIEGIADEMAVDNFKSIIALKQSNPDKVVLLLGNHDLHYYSDYYYELAGGVRYDPIAAIVLQRLFQDNFQNFQLAWETDWGGKHYLFSHAGITQSWLKKNLHLIRKPDANHLNRLLLSNEGLEALAQVGEMRQIVGHSMQYDGPIITDKFACLDCRAAFCLNNKGKIKSVTQIIPYEEYF